MNSSIANDAQRLSVLFQFGVITVDEVISWADAEIVALASPPTALVELSTTPPMQTDNIISHLHTLAEGADFWSSFRSALARLHEYVVLHPADAERIAGEIYRTAVFGAPSDVPDDLRFVHRYDDAFALAREGTWGNSESVRTEFVNDLHRFRSTN